jgi:hypothetical protein
MHLGLDARVFGGIWGEGGLLFSSVTDAAVGLVGRVCRGEEAAGDQLGAVARLRGAAGVATAGGQPRRLLPPRPQRAGGPLLSLSELIRAC